MRSLLRKAGSLVAGFALAVGMGAGSARGQDNLIMPPVGGSDIDFPPPTTENSRRLGALEENLNREHPGMKFVVLDPDRISFSARLPSVPGDASFAQMLEYTRMSQYIDQKAGADIGYGPKMVISGFYQAGEAASLKREFPDGSKVCVISTLNPDRSQQDHLQGYFDFEGFGRYEIDLGAGKFDLTAVSTRHEVAHCLEDVYSALPLQKKRELLDKKDPITDEDLYTFAYISHKQEVYADLMAAMDEPAATFHEFLEAAGTLRTTSSLPLGNHSAETPVKVIDDMNKVCRGAATYSERALKALGDLAVEKGVGYFSTLTYAQKMDIAHELTDKYGLALSEFAVICGYHREGEGYIDLLDNEGKTDEASREAAEYVRGYSSRVRGRIKEILTAVDRQPPYFRTFQPYEAVSLLRTVAVMRAKPAAERDVFEQNFIDKHDAFLQDASTEIPRRLEGQAVTAQSVDMAAASWMDDMRAQIHASKDAPRDLEFKLVLLRGLVMTGYLKPENWQRPAPTPAPKQTPQAIR